MLINRIRGTSLSKTYSLLFKPHKYLTNDLKYWLFIHTINQYWMIDNYLVLIYVGFNDDDNLNIFYVNGNNIYTLI